MRLVPEPARPPRFLCQPLQGGKVGYAFRRTPAKVLPQQGAIDVPLVRFDDRITLRLHNNSRFLNTILHAARVVLTSTPV